VRAVAAHNSTETAQVGTPGPEKANIWVIARQHPGGNTVLFLQKKGHAKTGYALVWEVVSQLFCCSCWVLCLT
jgi:hypothetical protein